MDPTLAFTSVAEFEEWLDANHDSADDVWVALPKKGTGVPSVTRGEALDVALCYGWIDGKATSQTTPEGWWAQRFCPRRARSRWSKINRIKVAQLIKEGRMQPPGLEQIELAKADGRWAAAYDPPSRAMVSPQLQAALDANPAAAAAFAELTKSGRYQILLNLQTAKKEETKARRIAGYVERLAAGLPPHPAPSTKR